MDPSILVEIVHKKMPFGKYQHVKICDLPISYLEWFAQKGWPPGRLGHLLSTIYEIKINGLEHLLKPLKTR